MSAAQETGDWPGVFVHARERWRTLPYCTRVRSGIAVGVPLATAMWMMLAPRERGTVHAAWQTADSLGRAAMVMLCIAATAMLSWILCVIVTGRSRHFLSCTCQDVYSESSGISDATQGHR